MSSNVSSVGENAGIEANFPAKVRENDSTAVNWTCAICGLLIFATFLIPWGGSDEKFLWSFSFFSTFYTLPFKVIMVVVWVAGLLELFAALKLRGIQRSILFAASGAVLAFYLHLTKANPVAWTGFQPFAASGIWIHAAALIALLLFTLATGVRERSTSNPNGSVVQGFSALLIVGLSSFGAFSELAGSSSERPASPVLVALLALGLCAVGALLSFTRRVAAGRMLVMAGVFIPLIEQLFVREQAFDVFAYLNTEIIVVCALLIMVEGLIGLSLRYRHALLGSSSVLVLAICTVAALQHTPRAHAHTTHNVALDKNTAPTAPPEAKRTGDWTQWCGATDRNMVWNEKGLPSEFEAVTATKTEGLKNVKWVVPLSKRTLGSPVIAGGKVFIGGEDIEGGKEDALLWCFDEASGKLLWRMVSPYIPALYNKRSYGNCATPTVEGDRLYTCNHLGDVLCLTTDGLAKGNQGPFQDEAHYFARGRTIEQSEITPEGRHVFECTPGTPATLTPFDADIVWRFDLMREVNAYPFNALNSAVLIRGNNLFVGTTSVRSDPYFGDESSAKKIDAWMAKSGKTTFDSPSLIVLDKATGKLLARDREDIFAHTFHGAHASPTLGNINGKDLLIYGGGNGTCYAFDPDFTPASNGAAADLTCVWKFNCLSERINHAEIIGTPVFYKNRVYVAIGNDLARSGPSAGPGRLVCIDATQSGDVTSSAKIWSYDEIRSSSCTVAIADDILYTGDAVGNIYCFDAETGALLWRHTAKHPVWSSPLIADGKVYIGLHDGGVMVFAHGREKHIIAENLGNADIVGSPAIANCVLYYASQRNLYALQAGTSGGLVPLPAELSPVKP